MALDSGIAKMGIFAFIFLVCFIALLSLIPPNFAVVTRDYGDPMEKIPTDWHGISLIGENFTGIWTLNLTTTATWATNTTAGRNLGVASVWTDYVIGLTHRYGFLLSFHEDMDWFNRAGKEVSYNSWSFHPGFGWVGGFGYWQKIHKDAIQDDFDDYGDMRFDVVCRGLGAGSSYFQLVVMFYFNSTTYTDVEDAWDNSDLKMLIGLTAENAAISLNVAQLITSLLTFNTVEVFGNSSTEALLLNGVLAAAIFAPIIIFAAAVILEALPF